MLKLTYTQNGFDLELVNQSLEKWLKNRLWVSVRAATSFFVEPSSASFLVPAHCSSLEHLAKLQSENGEIMAIAPADPEFVEISLYGNWIVGDPNSEEGIFITQLTQKAEFFLFKLWQEAQTTPIEL